MKKTKLYLDTSVPSFLFADDAPEKREVTLQFWNILKLGLIPQKYQDDALHIALATYNEADAVISWNFKHMVKLKTLRGVNGINKMLGYRELEILTPQSWLQEDDNG